VNSFSKALAWEWAKKGVRVNNICPGWIVPYKAEEVAAAVSGTASASTPWAKPDDMEKALEQGTLYNMSGLRSAPRPPEDIANLALFLASDLSGYITGQLISVSGGRTCPECPERDRLAITGVCGNPAIAAKRRRPQRQLEESRGFFFGLAPELSLARTRHQRRQVAARPGRVKQAPRC